MALVASTNTFKSSNRTTLSIIPAAFSNDIEYWNPEHPPPTTPIRSPAGTGSCVDIISFTFAIADGVNTTGAVDVGALTTSGALTISGAVTTSGVTVDVAMGNLLQTSHRNFPQHP